MKDSYGFDFDNMREEERRGLPTYPYQGISGIKSPKDFEEALVIMGHDVPSKAPDPIPSLVHFDFLDPKRLKFWTENEIRREKDYGLRVKQHKNHVSIGFSPFHTYKCADLKVIREQTARRQRGREAVKERDARRIADTPEFLDIELDVFKTTKVYRKNLSTFPASLELVDELRPTGERETTREKLVAAFEVGIPTDDWRKTGSRIKSWKGEWRIATRTAEGLYRISFVDRKYNISTPGFSKTKTWKICIPEFNEHVEKVAGLIPSTVNEVQADESRVYLCNDMARHPLRRLTPGEISSIAPRGKLVLEFLEYGRIPHL